MEQCRQLYEYAYFIDAIRRRLREGLTREAAVDGAIGECIAGNILAEFLTRHRAEVTSVILEEYDEEQHMRTVYQEGYESGHASGYESGLASGYESGHQEGDQKRLIRSICRLLQKGYSPAGIAELLDEEQRLVEQICALAQAAAPGYDVEIIYQALCSGTQS